MNNRSLSLLLILSVLTLAACSSDNNSDGDCLSVTPNEDYVLSGTATLTDFVPASKTYTVRNNCDEDIALSIDEDVRWLDVEIAGSGSEQGVLVAGGTITVAIEVRYGTDNPQRLDQLDPGSYDAEILFEDESNDETVTRDVDLTVLANS